MGVRMSARCASHTPGERVVPLRVPQSPYEDRLIIEQVLQLYCGTVDVDFTQKAVATEYFTRWFQKSPSYDDFLRQKLSPLMEASPKFASRWRKTVDGKLALIVLWDQVSRNIYRDTPAMFARDEQCVELCRDAITSGEDRKLNLGRRSILYMPLMHAESVADQELSMRMFLALARECPDVFGNSLAFAKAHFDIIVRFGRFPHRNSILGRESTEEEIEFLQQPNSSF